MAAFVWAAAAAGNWSVGSNWKVAGVAQAAPPTITDDVTFGAGTGFTNSNLTVDATTTCKSLDMTSFTGTVALNAGLVVDGGGAIILPTAAITFSGVFGITTRGSASQTIKFNGCTLTGGLAVGNLSTDKLTIQDTSRVNGNVLLTAGTLDTSGQACTWSSFSSSNSNVRTLTLGASAITITSNNGTNWSTSPSTNMIYTANTAIVTFNTTGSAGYQISSATNVGGLSMVFNNQLITTSFAGSITTFTNLTVKTGAGKAAILSIQNNVTCTGTLTLGGSSTQGINRLLAQSNTAGTQRTITAAAYVINGDVDFMDVNLAYSGAPSWTNTGSAYIGDALGNAGAVTTNATVSATQTATGTASFTWSTHTWTSRVPLPQDDVSIPNAFVATQVITADMPRLGRAITCSCSGSPTLTQSVATSIFGSLNLTGIGTFGATTLTFAGRGSHTITTAGIQFGAGGGFTTSIGAPGGTYTLAGNLVLANVGVTTTLSINAGTFAAATFNVSCGIVGASGGGITRQIKLGSGTWTLWATGSTNVWAAGTPGNNCQIVPGTAVINITATDSAVTKTFVGAGQPYPTLRHIATGSAGLTITDSNSFATLDLECTTARTVTFPANGMQTVQSALTLQGAAAQLLSAVSSTPGTKTYIRHLNTGTSATASNTSLSADVLIYGYGDQGGNQLMGVG